MNSASNQILANAALSTEQHRRICGRDALKHRQHLLHLRAARHNVWVRVAFAQRFAQRPIFLAQVVDVQFLADHHAHLAERKWFQHVVAGSGFHGFDGRLYRTKGRHYHHWHRRVLAFYCLQEFQAVHARQLEIGDHEVNCVFAQKFQPRLCVAGGERGEAVLAEIQFEQAPHLGFVFDN